MYPFRVSSLPNTDYWLVISAVVCSHLNCLIGTLSTWRYTHRVRFLAIRRHLPNHCCDVGYAFPNDPTTPIQDLSHVESHINNQEYIGKWNKTFETLLLKQWVPASFLRNAVYRSCWKTSFTGKTCQRRSRKLTNENVAGSLPSNELPHHSDGFQYIHHSFVFNTDALHTLVINTGRILLINSATKTTWNARHLRGVTGRLVNLD